MGRIQLIHKRTDAGGNSVNASAMMNLQLDLEPPKIMGVKDITLYQGSTASYRNTIKYSRLENKLCGVFTDL